MSSRGKAVDGMRGTKTRLALRIKREDSWVAVVGGVLAMMGAGALLTPILTFYLATSGVDLALGRDAWPVLFALMISSLIGGYTAGRLAKRRTGWHGLLSGLFGLLLTGSYLIAQVAVQKSLLGIDDRAIPTFFPMVFQLGLYHSESALMLGLVFGFPGRILAAWIGGLLAQPRSAVVPSQPVVDAAPAPAPEPWAEGSSKGAPTPL